MSFDFILAKELDKEFQVYGRFYNVRHGNSVFECRSQVQIKRKNLQANEPDAIIVMINPGSCEPQDKSYNIPFVISGVISEVPYTPARPDETQRQIMRLMKMRNWNSVTIINLSDLRCGKLTKFLKLKDTAEQMSFHSHSIFSNERKKELTEILKTRKGPIIIGWGTNTIIRKDALYALDCLKNYSYTGPIKKHPFYYHPSPPPKEGKIQWLQKMEGLFTENDGDKDD